ncbi:MAG: hypothetical protein ACI97A_001222 [Planctomycetota bacterium]|jgi:hypothetical protein
MIEENTKIFCGRAYSAFIDQRSFAQRVDHASHSQDFMERYAAILRREWKRWRSECSGELIAALFLIFLMIIGKEKLICGVLALCFVLSALAHHYLIAKPLRQEMKELGL